MHPYSIGKFAPILENPALSHLINPKNERKLARFAQKYYRFSSCCGKLSMGVYDGIDKRRKYMIKFLWDSKLPLEIRAEIATIFNG